MCGALVARTHRDSGRVVTRTLRASERDALTRVDCPTPALAELALAVARALDDPAFAASVAHHRKAPVTVLSEPLMDAYDVARLLKIPAKTVQQYAREGRLPCRPLGRHVRFVRAEVACAIERGIGPGLA